MANNRLAILDTETGEAFFLAKGFGHGWSIRATAEKLEAWLNPAMETPRDLGSSGSCGHDTKLKLITEASPEWKTATWAEKGQA